MAYFNEYMERPLLEQDPEIAHLIDHELERQRTHVELIASENFVPRAILDAMGSVLTNKYAEGYPYRKYYGGCEFVEKIEEIAIERAKKLFGAYHANVQPHSGSTANQAAYFTVLNPGDTMLAMRLNHDKHLSHGHRSVFRIGIPFFLWTGFWRSTARKKESSESRTSRSTNRFFRDTFRTNR